MFEGAYTRLPGSPSEEKLLREIEEVRTLPELKKLYDRECRVVYSDPLNQKAKELGLDHKAFQDPLKYNVPEEMRSWAERQGKLDNLALKICDLKALEKRLKKEKLTKAKSLLHTGRTI